MSNLAKKQNTIEINYLPSLSKPEMEIVKSSRTDRVFQLTDEELKNTLIESIINAASIIGNKSLSEEDFRLMKNQLFDYILINNKYSFIGEIQLAIKFGSFGKYLKEKDVLFLSVANIAKWIKSYESEKVEVLSIQSKFERETRELEEQKIKDMEASKKYWIDLPSNIDRCRDKIDSPMASTYFESLWSLSLIKLSEGNVKKIKESAAQEIKNELRAKRKNILKIGEENLYNMIKKRFREKSFYLWIEENRLNDIEEIVRKAIEVKK